MDFIFSSDIWIEILICFDKIGNDGEFFNVITCSKVLYRNITISNYLLNKLCFIVPSQNNFIPPYIKKLSIKNINSCLPKNLIYLLIYDYPNLSIDEKIFPNSLETLIFHDCKYLNLSFCSSNFPNLVSLQLFRCPIITDDCIKDLPETLKELVLAKCHNITDYGLMKLPKNLKRLEIFNMSLAYFFISQLPDTLEELKLNSISAIFNGGNTHYITVLIKKYPKNLRILDFSSSYVNNKHLRYLPENLEILMLNDCLFVTEETIEYLSKNLKELHISKNQTDIFRKNYKKNLRIIIDE